MQELSTEGNGASVEERLDGLRAELAFQVTEPQGGDQRIATCNEALQEIFIPDSQLYKICTGAFERRSDLSALHANRLLVRGFQRPALRRAHTIDYPHSLTTPGDWINLQNSVLEDKNERRRLRRDMYENSVQTNFDERGKSLKLLPLLMPERFAHPLRILELGAGSNHILKKLALNAYGVGYHYDNVIVKRPAPEHELGSTETVEDPDASYKLNSLLGTGQIAVKEFLGLDKESNKLPGAVEWLRSQFYPSEYLDPGFIEKFDLIQLSAPADVRWRQVDILELARSPDLMARVMRRGPYDFVLYGTFLYQLTKEGREAAEWVGNQTVDRDNGIKVYQDFIDVDPADPSRLTIEKHWGAYTYRTIIEDMRSPGNKQVLFVWRRGRCDEVQIGPAEICLEDTTVKATELFAA